MRGHSCHYCKFGNCTTTKQLSLLEKLSYGIIFLHPFHALVHGQTSSDILSFEALLDLVYKKDLLFRSKRIQSGDSDHVQS